MYATRVERNGIVQPHSRLEGEDSEIDLFSPWGRPDDEKFETAVVAGGL